jgi:hypothetical protein
LFVFVAGPEVLSHNNLAEHSVRLLVIARMDLFRLFGIWAAQGLTPFFQCLAELSQQHSLR